MRKRGRSASRTSRRSSSDYGCYSYISTAAGKGDFVVAVAGVKKQIAEQLSDIARAQALKMFYANEAYQSEGPFAHVVTAGQAVETDIKTKLAIEQVGEEEFNKLDNDGRKDLMDSIFKSKGEAGKEMVKEEMTKRRVALPPEQCLQSFTEQLGDFLKDLEHYGDEDPGVAIVQSSKYLDRLLDAVKLMVDKKMFEANPGLAGRLQAQVDLQDDVKGQLIAARKGLLWMEPDPSKTPEGGTTPTKVDQTEQRRAFACEFMKEKLRVTSIAGLAKIYVKLGMEVNAVARKWLADHPA